jgi:glycosyltransferase involved in cell wall biosynthesis
MWKESRMTFSIITVVRNAAATVGNAIESVAGQRFEGGQHVEAVEHVVVDGGSTDGTLEVINGYRSQLGRVVSEPDRGIYDAMNKGLKLATGDIIGFLNADDIYADNHVLRDVASCLQDPAVDAVYGDLIYVSASDPSRVVRYWRSGEYRAGRFQSGWMPAHPTLFVRRGVYERFGGFDLSFRLQSDFDLTMRLLEVHRIKAVYLPRILVRMRLGGATNRSVANVIRGNLEAYRACRKNAVKVSPLFVVRKPLSRVWQFFVRPPDEAASIRP